MRSSIIAALSLSLGILLPLQAGAGIGFISAVEGQVDIQATGTTSFSAAGLDSEVQIGDIVRTGLDSTVKILLVDDTALTLDEDTELLIDSYVVGPAATTERSVLRQLQGQVQVSVGEAFGGPTRVEMHTPTAVIGVKGTKYLSQIKRSSRKVSSVACTITGLITVRHIDPNIAGVADVGPGFCTEVFEDRFSRDPFEMPLNLSELASQMTASANAATGAAHTATVNAGPAGVAAGGNQRFGQVLNAVITSPPPVGAGGEGGEGFTEAGGEMDSIEPGTGPTLTQLTPPPMPMMQEPAVMMEPSNGFPGDGNPEAPPGDSSPGL